ncbi:hypothetical protein ABFT23_07330 [Nocardioides sp. C4-1]|uniref:hypothetical protein n=1 Tax=Nocardioides sp. C4-1 TaxID=3151851 RepID=UPI003264B093
MPLSVSVSASARGYARLAFYDLVEVRPTGPHSLSGTGAPWVRLTQGPRSLGLGSDAAVLAVLLDVPTPGLFALPTPPVFVPTSDVTMHLAPTPEGPSTSWCDWTYLTHGTAWATDDQCVDAAQAWTADGRLLAQATQTRSVRWT